MNTLTKKVLSPTNQIVLNFFKANFNPGEVDAWRGKYDESAFRELSQKPSIGLLRDRGEGNLVYAWSRSSDIIFQESGFSSVRLNKSSHPTVFARIMVEGLDNHLRTLGFTRLPSKPAFYRYVNFSSGNLLSEIAKLQGEKRIGIFPKVILQSFITSFQKDSPQIGLLVDVDYAFRLDIPVAEFIKLNMDIRGQYVRLRVPEGIETPLKEYDNHTIGRVKGIAGNKLQLDDVRHPSIYEVQADWCFADPNRHNFNYYLQTAYRSEYQELQKQINDKFAKHISPKRRCNLIETFVTQRLSTNSLKPIKLNDQLSVWFDPNYPIKKEHQEFTLGTLGKPMFSFDPASDRVHESADKGLDEHGPYDHEKMAGRKLRILFIAPDTFKGQVEKFIEQFNSGLKMPDIRYRGFVDKYRISSIDLKAGLFKIRSVKEANDYFEYCRQVAASQQEEQWDMCFVVTRQVWKNLPAKDNPYFLCKNLLLGFDIPVQDVLVETLAKPNNSLQFILNNIALAVYAKLGGIPFVLKTPKVSHYELVFGIGSAIQKQSRFGAGNRVVGITTLFSRDGDYILNGCTPYTDFDSYERRLKETVEKAIKDAIEIQAINPDEKIRLIFHVFKEIGRKETQAIQEAISVFDKHDIEYAIAHVNTDHEFKMFDRTNPGQEWDYTSRRFIGNELAAYVAQRGLTVELGPRDRLVNLIGPTQYRKRGCPSPLRVTLDRTSTFKDIDYITDQIYQFAFMSWRGFQPSKEPITILYSSLVADLNSKLNDLGGWNPERVNINLRRKMWFL